jgi:hypothetical protein
MTAVRASSAHCETFAFSSPRMVTTDHRKPQNPQRSQHTHRIGNVVFTLSTMDLQAILDGSDDSSDSGDDVAGGYHKKAAVPIRVDDHHAPPHQQRRYSEGSNVDLEQILREDDDSQDSSSPPRSHAWDSAKNSVVSEDQHHHNQHVRGYTPSTSTSHAPDDWDVLQAILGENDDDLDGNHDADSGLDNSTSYMEEDWIQATTRSSSHVNVDAILQSDEEDDDLDDTNASQIMMRVAMAQSPNRTSTNGSLFSNSTLESRTMHYGDGRASPKNNYVHSSSNPQSLQILTNEDTMILSEQDHEQSSRCSLQYAQAYERKLLKSGRRDIVSPLMVKRRLKPKIELGTRIQQKQKQNQKKNGIVDRLALTASTSANTAMRFGFSGVVENKTMPGVSMELMKKHQNKKGETIDDLPTALAVNSRFIAVGTQRGIILVFDLFEVLRQRLGAKVQAENSQFNSKTAGSVTSVDLSLLNGEVLAAGYTSGILVLWDIIKGVALRSVSETHPSPITSVRFLTDLKMVSVDAGGLVNKLTFTKNILWSTYSVETECLLDGTAGQILAMNVLAPFSSVKNQVPPEAASPSLRKLVLIALSSERSSFAVAVEPSVHVLHRWARPPLERMEPSDSSIELHDGQVYLPCLSWGWALVSGGGNVITPILARAWGCCIQLLRANFPEAEAGMSHELFQWPAFGIHDEFDVTAPVVALEWLSDRSLVYLTVTNEFTVVDTVMMTLLERLDFSGYKLVYAEFSLSRSAKEKAVSGVDAGSFCTTFQNSVRSCDDRLMILCQEELKSASIVGAKRRISGLEADGEWLEALALALDHYDNTIKSQEDRRRDPEGRRDMSKHPEFNSATKSEDEEWIAKLLIRYLNIAVENAPETSADIPGFASELQLDLAQSHFQMLAGVCVEFCVVTRRLDLLFGPIFRRFHSVRYLTVFLDVLEPYILNDKLDYIAPEAMAHFVEHCRATNDITTVERCLLHMNVTIMDFDSILSLLRANEMYSALFYVFNQGLDDFTTPLEILMEKIFDAADTHSVTSARRLDGVPQNDFERYGYKAITYLESCFSRRTFPQDVELQPEERVHILRSQLLRFLLQEQFSSSGNVRKPDQIFGQRAVRYPYTHILLMVDPRAMFDTMSIALDAPDSEFGKADSNFESIGGWEVEVGEDMSTTGSRGMNGSGHGASHRSPDRQQIIAMFTSIILPEKNDVVTTHQTTLYQSQTAVNAFLDFLAVYLMKGVVRANKSVTFMILTRMAQRFAAAKDPQERQHSQSQIIELLTALSRNSYEPQEVLKLVEASGIHRAALLLHQEGASSWHEGIDDTEKRAHHFRCAIDCYLEDDDHDFRKEVFAYAKKECSGSAEEPGGLRAIDPSKPMTLRGALAAKLADLVRLDSLLTAELVAELFVEDVDHVIESLETGDGSKAQFMFLQAIISGDLNQMDPVASGVLNAHLTMEHHHKYLALMAKLHPELVYEYLSTHDNYRPEECLQLCQKHDIADASAYLLERMGNVSSALQLILQTLESRMMGLKRTIRGMGTDFFRQHTSRTLTQRWKKGEASSSEFFGKQEKEVDGVKRILIVALDLCERNSGTFSKRTEHGSQLWFNVLDRLINAKGFLRLSKEHPGHAKVMAGVLSELLRLTMQRMVSSVPLPDLVRKVTHDHSGSCLGELREMVESLLSTYGLELNVFNGAVNVFHHDSQQMQISHRALRVQGSSVRAVMNISLDKPNAVEYKEALEITSNRGDVLQLTEGGNASLSGDSRGAAKSRATDAGFGNALARLRSRRAGSGYTGPLDRCRSTGLNFMTASDQMHLQEQTSPEEAFFEERLVGELGEAEHRGRLMSFMY